MSMLIKEDTQFDVKLANVWSSLDFCVKLIKDWAEDLGFDKVRVSTITLGETDVHFTVRLIDDFQDKGEYEYHGEILYYIKLESNTDAFARLISERDVKPRREREIVFMQTRLAEIKEAADRHGFVTPEGKGFATELIESWKHGAKLLTHVVHNDDA